jgi:hypothetical protein
MEKEFISKETGTEVYKFATTDKPFPDFSETRVYEGVDHVHKRILRVCNSLLFFNALIIFPAAIYLETFLSNQKNQFLNRL